MDVRESARRIADKPLLSQHIDQYLKVIEENGAEFVRRSGDAGGGQYSVCARKAADQLLEALLDHTVTERLGSKAHRIFRLIRSKKYIEEEDIQKNAMLPNKECKELTYKLLEEHFISVQPMRKAASAGGTAKAIYLYHVKIHEVAHTVREMCYRALHNIISVGAHVRQSHARLLDKQRRVRSIVHGMRIRGEPQHNIDDVLETLTPPELAAVSAAETRLRTLAAAEIELDRALFLLSCYFAYPR
ncbi:jg6039 [Pararge aegeria aegeria]|uniref:DNA-directed RNA polymerase III subunit RPC3 n=6 Tax=Pararge aegeria TaxID=116150 RepID=A0A8S4QE15_9NEOP|nr:jg6039 [Pararge aegeria aegeria]